MANMWWYIEWLTVWLIVRRQKQSFSIISNVEMMDDSIVTFVGVGNLVTIRIKKLEAACGVIKVDWTKGGAKPRVIII